jgi:hypothetical protein
MMSSPEHRPHAALVLSKATRRAAEQPGLSDADLVEVLSVSTSSIDQLVAEQRVIDPASKEGQLAAILTRICRALDALLGDAMRHSQWMQSHTTALNGKAIDLIKTPAGITHTLDYLDSIQQHNR